MACLFFFFFFSISFLYSQELSHYYVSESTSKIYFPTTSLEKKLCLAMQLTLTLALF